MYFKLSAADTAKRIDTDPARGLSQKDAAERLSSGGANAISEKKRRSIPLLILQQLNEPMIYVLFAAAVLSAFVDEWANSLVILAIVIVNAVIGAVQERRAEQALSALKKLTMTMALARRDGMLREVPADELVVGDVVLLEAGRVVPADVRLTVSERLSVNESTLTGESTPVEKDASFLAARDIPLGDRVNMAYQGTVVTAGRGEGIVVATGMSTEVGQIAELVNTQDPGKTPLQKKLASLSKTLGIAAICACALILLIGLFQKREFAELLLTSISLAVAVVPEGLTAVVTIVLAMGVTRMARRRAIVRHLPAVETLGAVNVICTDKTGTLTQNKMTITSLFFDHARTAAAAFPSEYGAPLLHAMVLCNDASITGDTRCGDPTELALLDFAAMYGALPPVLCERFPRVDALPFDSGRKMMTTLHRMEGMTLSYTKGAEDVLLPRCTHIWSQGAIRPITDDDRAEIQAQTAAMSQEALRVLAFAMRSGDETPREDHLIFLGLAAMIDPPRREAIEAIGVCRKAGIRVVMITGDHKDTALAIATQTGICDAQARALTGAELDATDDAQLAAVIDDVAVFARVDPRHKVRIVAALKARGNVVAMTGDGVNDAPSLKAADIGVAMGITGTDAAKDAADLVLTDDNFATITHAVEAGRNIFENIRKAIIFLLASNMGELITVLVSVLLFWDAPLLPLHILWINLITDSLPALALGIDPGDARVMSRPPRPANQSLFAHGGGWSTLGFGAIIAAVTLFAFRFTLVSAQDLARAQTMALIVLAGSQLVYSLVQSAGERSIFRTNWLAKRFLLAAFGIGVLLQVIILYIPPLSALFSTAPLGAGDWALAAGLAIVPLLVHELVLLVRRVLKR